MESILTRILPDWMEDFTKTGKKHPILSGAFSNPMGVRKFIVRVYPSSDMLY